MRSLKTRSGIAALAIGALMLTTAACSAEPTEPAEPAEGCAWADTDITVGGGVTGGTYYVLAATISKLVNEQLDCVTATTTSGANVESIRTGVDILFTTPDVLYIANTGSGGLGLQEGEQFPYETVSVGYPNTSILITRNDGSPTNLSDFSDSDVIGTLGATSVPPLQAAAEAHGVSPEIQVIDSYDQMYTALRQGQITALHVILNHPAVQILEAENTSDLAAVKYDKNLLSKIRPEFPDYDFATTIKPGTYGFIDEEYYTWSRTTTITALTSVDPALVKEITRIIYEQNDALVAVAPAAAMFNLDTLEQATSEGLIRTPYHKGAQEYFDEIGVKY